MAFLLKYSWIPLLLLAILTGFNGMFLIEMAISLCILGGSGCFLNYKGLIPGTTPYKLDQQLRRAEIGLQIDRVERSRTRIRTIETADLNRTLALEKENDAPVNDK